MPEPGENSNNCGSQLTNFESLGQGPLAGILSFLSPKDICRASLTCRALRDAGCNDCVWYAKALERYPQSTLVLAPALKNSSSLASSTYPNHKALVLDDNRENASLLIPFSNGVSSDYKMNRPDYFFECCVTALQFNRTTDSLQVYFDCRGELDLRDPLSSSIAFVVHRPRPCRRELREELAHLNIQRHELRDLVERLEPMLKQADSPVDTASKHLSALRALNITSHRLYTLHTELQDSSNIAFSDLVTVFRPSSKESEYHFEVKKPGHYKGWIQFNNISQIDELVIGTDLDTSRARDGGGLWNMKKPIVQHGMDLVFTYANPVPVLPQMNQIDYHPVTLLHIPPASTFGESMKVKGKYASPEEFSEKFLIQESLEDELKRWVHVQRERDSEAGGRGRGRMGLLAPGSSSVGTSGGGGFVNWFV